MAESIVADSRGLRGLKLFQERGDEFVLYIDGTYGVPGSHGESYTVSLEKQTCTCPDFTRRAERDADLDLQTQPCKHMIAATVKHAKYIAEGRRQAEERARRSAERKTSRVEFTPEQIMANLERMGA